MGHGSGRHYPLEPRRAVSPMRSRYTYILAVQRHLRVPTVLADRLSRSRPAMSWQPPRSTRRGGSRPERAESLRSCRAGPPPSMWRRDVKIASPLGDDSHVSKLMVGALAPAKRTRLSNELPGVYARQRDRQTRARRRAKRPSRNARRRRSRAARPRICVYFPCWRLFRPGR